MSLMQQLTDDMKSAMRAKDKLSLATVRSVITEIKKQEIDTRQTLDDAAALLIVEKLVKQRRDSIAQFTEAGRDELAAKEQSELEVLMQYLPEQLDEAALTSIIAQCIEETGASTMADMGKLMQSLKPKIQGKADMAMVSVKVKEALNV